MSPEWTLTRYRALTATLWLDKGLLQQPFKLIRDESCDREEWTVEGKANSIKSQGQETQLGVIGTPTSGKLEKYLDGLNAT